MTEDQSMPEQGAGAFEAEHADDELQEAELQEAELHRAASPTQDPPFTSQQEIQHEGADDRGADDTGTQNEGTETEGGRRDRERHSNIPVTSGSHVDGPQPDSREGERLESGQPMVQAVDPHNERSESRLNTSVPGSAASDVADAPNFSGEKRPSPHVGNAEQAASQESRRIAEAQDTEL